MVHFGLYLIKVVLKYCYCSQVQFVVFWSNFDEILLNNNIQKCIIFIQNKDIAAARLLGYSYGEHYPEY